MDTFPVLVERYLQAMASKASWGLYTQLCAHHFSCWRAHPTLPEVEDWHISLTAKPHYANKGLSFLRSMYWWAIRRGHYTGPNPACGIRRHRTQSRERVMDSQEVALLIAALEFLPEKLSAMLVLLLLTGCRLGEARTMEWTHLNLQTGEWRQPTTKNGKPHLTYIPTQAMARLRALPRTGEYPFMGHYEHCWSRPGVEKQWRQVRKQLGLQDVRLHDFRRTFSTHAFRATQNLPLVKRCINHTSNSVTMIYVRFFFEDIRDAMQAQADRFFALRPAGSPQLNIWHDPLTISPDATRSHQEGSYETRTLDAVRMLPDRPRMQ